jgi:hypothetical protein
MYLMMYMRPHTRCSIVGIKIKYLITTETKEDEEELPVTEIGGGECLLFIPFLELSVTCRELPSQGARNNNDNQDGYIIVRVPSPAMSFVSAKATTITSASATPFMIEALVASPRAWCHLPMSLARPVQESPLPGRREAPSPPPQHQPSLHSSAHLFRSAVPLG